jgi:hypothetical protein
LFGLGCAPVQSSVNHSLLGLIEAKILIFTKLFALDMLFNILKLVVGVNIDDGLKLRCVVTSDFMLSKHRVKNFCDGP